ncbi:hypothetical protein Tco_0121555 [Tanacetum coccineum]
MWSDEEEIFEWEMRYHGPHREKDSEEFKPPVDMEPLTTPVADPSGTDANEDDVFEAGDELDEDIHHTDEEETQSTSPNNEQPKLSHAQDTKSDFDSSCPEFLKKYDNTYRRSVGKHKETTALYDDLKSEIEGFHDAAYKVHRGSLNVIQDVVKEDPVLNKKVTEATEAYTKNTTSLTELLTLIKSFDIQGLKNSSSAPLSSVPTTTLAITEVPSTVEGKNVTQTTTEEPPSHIEGENVGRETQETGVDKARKEQEPERPTRAVLILTSRPLIRIHPEGIATKEQLEPSSNKLVPASTVVRRDPDEPIRIPYEIHGKLYNLTNDEIQEYLNKEEEIKRNIEQAKLLAMTKSELIKVVHEEPEKARIDPKIIESAKGDFGVTKLDELGPIIQKKKNKIVGELMISLGKRYERLRKIPEELRIQSALPPLASEQASS